jgi:hypothetical protein
LHGRLPVLRCRSCVLLKKRLASACRFCRARLAAERLFQGLWAQEYCAPLGALDGGALCPAPPAFNSIGACGGRLGAGIRRR